MQPLKKLIKCHSADHLKEMLPDKMLEGWTKEFGDKEYLHQAFDKFIKKRMITGKGHHLYCERRELFLLVREWLEKEKHNKEN